MTILQFLNALSACLGLSAALFLCLGTARLSNQAIWLLSSTFWDFNPHVAEALSIQRAEYVTGAVLLVLTFLIQLTSVVLPMSATPSFPSAPHGLAATGIVTAVAVAGGLALRSRVAASTRRFVSQQASKIK
jgi:hypothetical protein